VINAGGLGTFFLCTSIATVPQSVTVEAFDETGTASGSGSLVVAAGKSVMFGTRSANDLAVDSNMASGGIAVGSARILSTKQGKLLYSAFVSDAAGSPPTSMVYLTVVKGLTQKGE
jgi:hypothetical protein